jgi:hypothetical protein
MPRFDRLLLYQAQLAIDITRSGEAMRTSGGQLGLTEWTLIKLEALYELAYMRIFAAWETCLENVLLRSLCGFTSRAVGHETLLPSQNRTGPYHISLANAEADMLGSHQYALWHNPQHVIKRCQRFIRSGAPGCPAVMETTISSSVTRLENLAAVRHRIVHEQKDARQKFDSAAISLAGRTYPASRPGKFLRDWDRSSVPKRRWLATVADELVALASQIV